MNKCQFAEVRNNEYYCLGTKEIDICPSEGNPYSSCCYYPCEKKNKENYVCIMGDMCGDNRFKIIQQAKEDLINSTNIETSLKEMEVLDSFLFRCWQMGWLEKYNFEE